MGWDVWIGLFGGGRNRLRFLKSKGKGKKEKGTTCYTYTHLHIHACMHALSHLISISIEEGNWDRRGDR